MSSTRVQQARLIEIKKASKEREARKRARIARNKSRRKLHRELVGMYIEFGIDPTGRFRDEEERIGRDYW